MPKTTEQPRRKRGVVLSVQGLQRLEAAKQQSEIQENFGNSYTLEELSERTQLSPNTLTRVQRRKVPVDRYTLERYFGAFNLTLCPSDYTQLDADTMPTQISLEFPSGPVPINSRFYINRPPIEELSYQEISKPGSVIGIKAPRKMGKSSLLIRIIAHATQVGYKTVSLDFQEADDAVFSSLNKFLRWFCANISRQLNLKPMLDDYWDEDMGSKVSCTIYLEGYLLEQINTPLVLALNEVNRVFEHPNIAQDFLPLLRFWHEQAKQVEIFQKLRLVVVHSTEIYIPLRLNQSPFNVGLPIKLPQLSLRQVQDLALRHGLDWADGEVGAQRLVPLVEMLGGHPYLVRVALYHLCQEEVTLEQLLQEAPTQSGIFSNHLRSHLAKLAEEPKLLNALKQLIIAKGSVRLEPLLAHKLDSMGLVKLEGDECNVSCELYRRYFESQNLSGQNLPNSLLQQLQQENQELQDLVNIDALTQTANQRYFDKYLRRVWQRLANDAAPLSLILCDIDYFKAYNKYYGHQAGDNCLQQVASVIRQVLKHSADLAARYGGEEFAVILPQTEANDALQIAEEIRVRVKALAISCNYPGIDGLPASVLTVSLGVASTIPDSESNYVTIIDAAQQALYQAKRQGRDRISLYR